MLPAGNSARFDEALQQFQAALTIAQKTGDARGLKASRAGQTLATTTMQ